MDISHYLDQLLEDMEALMQKVPPCKENELPEDADDAMVEEYMMRLEACIFDENGIMIFQLTGISSENLPEVALLDEVQLELLYSGMINLLEHYQFIPEFDEDEAIAIRYEKLRERWDTFTAPSCDCELHMDFSKNSQDDCAFSGKYECCDENAQVYRDMVDRIESGGYRDISGEDFIKEAQVLKGRLLNLPKGKFVMGMHNYCDRWCERCSMWSFCTAFAVGEGLGKDKVIRYDWGEDWEQRRRADYEVAIVEVRKEVEKLGLCALEVARGEGIDVVRKYHLEIREEGRPILELAEYYSKSLIAWLTESGHDKLKEVMEEEGVLETISWYMTMIATKTFRTLHMEEFDDDMVQSDCNGSAKVLLKCISQSMYAWSWVILNKAEYRDHALTFMILLDGLERGIRELFPQADEFIRPGFDERKEDWVLV